MERFTFQEIKTISSAITERPRCRIGLRQFWPEVEDDILQTL